MCQCQMLTASRLGPRVNVDQSGPNTSRTKRIKEQLHIHTLWPLCRHYILFHPQTKTDSEDEFHRCIPRRRDEAQEDELPSDELLPEDELPPKTNSPTETNAADAFPEDESPLEDKLGRGIPRRRTAPPEDEGLPNSEDEPLPEDELPNEDEFLDPPPNLPPTNCSEDSS